MIFSMEKFGETVLPENNKLSEGKQSIMQKFLEMKGEGVCILGKESYLRGSRIELNLLKTFHETGPDKRRVIEISSLLGKMIVENPERV